MSDVKSKNLYELLGNDHDEDSDKEPQPPTKAIDKTLPRSTKKVAPEQPARGGAAGGRGGRRGGYSGNEGAIRDRDAGAQQNRGKPTDETDRPRRGRGAMRGGGRGRDIRDTRDDRRSKGLPHDHPKQADQSWGGPSGEGEWNDEKAGEAIARADAKDPAAEGAEEEAEPEPEDNSKSFSDYLAEQAQKKLNLGNPLEARKPNEGSKVDKKWAKAKALPQEKDEDEEAYFVGGEKKANRIRERKEKQLVDIDHRFVEQPRERGTGGRGGRGRGGDSRGGRSERGERGGRGGRGGPPGARGGAPSAGRGGRGGQGGRVDVGDTTAFPSLGA